MKRLTTLALCIGALGCQQDPRNSPPVAEQVLRISVPENGSISIETPATDPDGDPLTFAATTPAHGTVSGTGPTFTYAPNADFAGSDTFLVAIADGHYEVDVTVYVTVTSATDESPVAISQSVTTSKNQGVRVVLTGSDPETRTLSYRVTIDPAHGRLSGRAPNLTYTPDQDFFGNDAFEFVTSDGNSESAPATVTITVANTETCGDGTVNGTEQCDDGNVIASDACLVSCVVASCGDGIVQTGVEECDDGNAVDTDSCTNGCKVASCGDGIVQAGVEACDDGNGVASDSCLPTCAPATCGDGEVQADVEACDDANADQTDGCLATCVIAHCGDGFVQAGVEACDDGNGSDDDACLTSCVPAVCGDGHVQAGVEQCDDGNANDADGCSNACQRPVCGDGATQGDEGCDDGNSDDTDACPSSCRGATCGDGFVQAGVEQCDDGNSDDNDACTNACMTASCGDGLVQAGVEQCDDGNADNTDACLATCVPASCGDGFAQAGVEQCDDGNGSDADTCSTTCQTLIPPVCGNGVVEGSEACDDGNDIDNDLCNGRCQAPGCGNGLIEFAVGETCDDGNTTAADGCDATCHSEPFTTQAPVKISDTLSCTTAIANSSRKIAVDASGVVYAVMQCGTEPYVVVSRDRGATYSAPQNLASTLPANTSVSFVAVATAPSEVAYVAILASNRNVYLTRTSDSGASWGTAALIGTSSSTSAGLSLQAYNDDVFLGVPTSGGIAVSRNRRRGVGDFTTDTVSLTMVYFDLCYDPTTERLAVASDTPAFHIRTSADRGVSWSAESAPAGSQMYSDWGSGNGNLYVVGSSTTMQVIPNLTPTSSVTITGLPAGGASQARTVAGDPAGNAYVATQLVGSGIQLDRLPYGASAFDAPITVAASGSSPIVTGLPDSSGAAVVFTVGTEVWAAVKTY